MELEIISHSKIATHLSLFLFLCCKERFRVLRLFCLGSNRPSWKYKNIREDNPVIHFQKHDNASQGHEQRFCNLFLYPLLFQKDRLALPLAAGHTARLRRILFSSLEKIVETQVTLQDVQDNVDCWTVVVVLVVSIYISL